MQYFTREFYGKASVNSMIPNCLTVISIREYNYTMLMQKRIDEYAKIEMLTSSIKKEKHVQGYVFGSRMALKDYEFHLKLMESFLDNAVLSRIRDIRVLALRYVTRQEMKLLKAWAKEYKKYEILVEQAYGEHLQEIEDRLPSSIKQFLAYDFFDLPCKKAMREQDRFTMVYGEDEALQFEFMGVGPIQTSGTFDYLLAREVYLLDDGTCSLKMLFKKGEIALQCDGAVITDRRIWYKPDDLDAQDEDAYEAHRGGMDFSGILTDCDLTG